jgi:hypothetical protein
MSALSQTHTLPILIADQDRESLEETAKIESEKEENSEKKSTSKKKRDPKRKKERDKEG